MESADIDIKTAIMDMSKQSGTERKMSINIIWREVENTTKQNELKRNSRFEECNIWKCHQMELTTNQRHKEDG